MTTSVRYITPLACLLIAACSGSKGNPDDQPTESSASLLDQCSELSERTQKEAHLYATMALGSRETAEAAFVDFTKTIERWEAEDNACKREGSNVTERMSVQQTTDEKLEQATTVGTNRILEHLAPNTDEARAFMLVAFGSGHALGDATLNTAVDIDRKYRQRLLEKFNETGKYGQLAEGLETTCIFGDAKIDPNAEKITDNFQTVFTGTGEVHALCRIPVPAEKFGGDPNGKLELILDDDADPSNGVISTGDLGAPEKWGSTQWFSGRFSMPQGAHAQNDSGIYYVWLKAVRPEMGDEDLVHNHFYWHR